MTTKFWDNPYGITSLFVLNRKFFISSLFRKSGLPKSMIYLIGMVFLKNEDSVSQEFNLRRTHFLEWYGVLNSISNKWKRRIKNVAVEHTTLAKTSVGIEKDKMLVPLESTTTKIICKLFISGKFEPPTSKKLFSNQYNIYNEGTWRIIYSLPAHVTTDIKIRMFQYKILNNILFLNQRLYYMKKIDSPLCSLCKREAETVPRLFQCGQSENL